jgi:hypothetical protein
LFAWARSCFARVLIRRTERLESFVLVLFVVAAILVRIWGASRIHFGDEMVYLQNAQVICCPLGVWREVLRQTPLGMT